MVLDARNLGILSKLFLKPKLTFFALRLEGILIIYTLSERISYS
ncbi:hypothetical protein PMIT1342_02133 [Prochlorococcus marinus str. MIT 1342]|nr:hypothetical protein PMIT1342_02133 [Prochlorococcus marinus str. MIT 1342]